MTDQAKVLRGLMERRGSAPGREASPLPTSAGRTILSDDQHDGQECPSHARARTIAVTSGKGGVGKSNIALNLAIALAQTKATVCLLDGNLGLGNIDLLCRLNGYWNLSHVITGARTLQEIVLPGPAGVNVIPGASGLCDLADCPAQAQQEILSQLEELERTHDFLILDTGTGIHRSVRGFLSAADTVLVVTTPEPTSIADAYATLKALSAGDVPELLVLVNQAGSSHQAQAIIERLQQTSRLFLRLGVGSAGFIPRDEHVVQGVIGRSPFLLQSPHCPAAAAIRQLMHRVRNRADVTPARGAFFLRLWNRFFPRPQLEPGAAG